tara:strand:+ start:1102 stop:2058 length:957 start_codon:yes stop_codon:yes gene_type:complete
MPPKKRGRKPKKKTDKENKVKPPPKKRGRKPKGGKIVKLDSHKKPQEKYTPNIIMHLKVSSSDKSINNITSLKYEPNIENPEAFNFNDGNLNYQEIQTDKNEKVYKPMKIDSVKERVKETEIVENVSIKDVWTKLNTLKHNLKTKNISDKNSSCFWCTCPFDNPAIHIPKHYIGDKIEVYGCFCSPECAVSYLKNENLDTSTMWDRYALLNNIYGRIYDYDKNIKPAPSPFYTLDKYYGNLSIQEYRKLLTNNRLIMVVDKPMAKMLPEIYEENNEMPDILNNILINKNKNIENKYTLKSKEKFKTKTAILKNSFNVF